MNQNQKTAAHIILIPAQIAIHTKVDSSLKQNGVGPVGRGIAQAILFGIGLWAHGAIEDS
ncbi:MAG: hypothetical protein ACYCSG_06515 [Thermoplasmataceae archaeon]